MYPHLFSPITIGRTVIRNRIAMLPMAARLSPDGTVSDAERAWSEERAQGGIGVMVSGGAHVHPTSSVRGNPMGMIEGWREEGLEAQRRRVEAVHRHGAKIFGQLLHVGRDVASGSIGGLVEHPVLAPSAIRSPTTEWGPRAMDEADISMVVKSFGHTAAVFQQAGMDGIEIHAAHNYLIGQFMSPPSNRRDDQYSASSIDNRMRFLMSVIAEVRTRCGDSITLGVRLSAIEEIVGGITIDDTKRFAERLEASKMVDYLSLTVGVRGAYVKDGSAAPGVAIPSAVAVRKVTGLPLMVGSRVNTPELAEQMIADGVADIVGLGRPLIADPQFAGKASVGEARKIRPCVAFVQDCRMSQGGVTCGVNASAGREVKWSAFAPISKSQKRRVVIAGGGPGGLEAARVAAAAGHEVVLFEREQQLGGQLLRAARAPYRQEFVRYLTYLQGEFEERSVKLKLGVEATAEDLLAVGGDLVVIATGAIPDETLRPAAPASAIPVLTTWELLDGSARELGDRVLLVDDGTGFWEICGVADLLVQRGTHVEFITPNATIGRSIPHESLAPLHKRLLDGGCVYSPFTQLKTVETDSAVVTHVVSGQDRRINVDTVVVQIPQRTVNSLERALNGRVRSVSIGDAVSPRRLGYAIFDANTAIRGLS